MVKNITVGTNKKYDVVFLPLKEVGDALLQVARDAKVMIVTDKRVASLYLEDVTRSIKGSGFSVFSHVIDEGEGSKNYNTYLDIVKEMHLNTFVRSDVIVALGGGVVGDIAGFCAATYMRGISYVQIPTTLLAMIDSSIGGKTAIDFGDTKNLIGAFYQPSLVAVDVNTLNTLEDVEWKNGLGEGVKYAILKGGKIAKLISKGIDSGSATELVYECIKYKAKVVKCDEWDRGVRRFLNLGHTIGHALEGESEYALKHGIAVAKGIRVMLDCALKNNEIKRSEYKKIDTMLRVCGFYDSSDIDVLSLMKYIALDKKADDKAITLVKIKGVGRCRLQRMSLQDYETYLMRK